MEEFMVEQEGKSIRELLQMSQLLFASDEGGKGMEQK